MGTIEITVWGCSRRLETPSKSFPTLDVIIGGHLSIVALLVWGGLVVIGGGEGQYGNNKQIHILHVHHRRREYTKLCPGRKNKSQQ